MKKILTLLFCLMSLPASAINPDTQLKWNAVAVEAAARRMGFDDYYYNAYVVILHNLLERETFSVSDAVEVCFDALDSFATKTNINMFASPHEVAAECEEFGMALISENNKKTDSLVGYKGRYSNLGKVYDDSKSYYAEASNHSDDGKCYWSVFEAKTNKKIAVCESMFPKNTKGPQTNEKRSELITFKTVDQNFKTYDFALECTAFNECMLRDGGYKELYARYQLCAEKLAKVDFIKLDRAINKGKGVFMESDAIHDVRTIHQARKFVRNNSASPSTTNLYYELYEDYMNNCTGLPRGMSLRRGGFATLDAYADTYVTNVTSVENFFKHNTKKYARVQVHNLKEAENLIRNDLNKILDSGYRVGKVNCKGTCNHTPGSQDYINCRVGFGDFRATFEFDDICD